MKTPRYLACALAVLSAAFQLPLFGQFYAPDTEFHDPVQRLFVVEAARVLAWRENLKGSKIQSVSYKTNVGADRKTNWQLDWLEARNKTNRHFELSYPENLLTSGPRFYRDVFAQLRGKDESSSGAITEQGLAKFFWQSAESAGLSRVEGLRAALKLVSPKPSVTDQELAPRLAGVLSHTALPSLDGTVTIDAVLLARAAAWLCMAESMVKDRSPASDALWAPILFLASRENAASDLWKKDAGAAAGRLNASKAWAAWNFFLQRPKCAEAFAFAARPENRQFAMPVMIYYSSLLQIGSTLAEVVPLVFGEDEETLGRLHDANAFMSRQTGVGGGRILEGRWPVLARKAWLDLMSEFKPAAPDYTGYEAVLKQAAQDVGEAMAGAGADRQTDSSLLGFKAAAPLIELGFRQGTGKLVPVAAVTARDLLNFGWEMTGLQMGERYRFVQHSWGVHELAKPIIETVQHEVGGLDFFFEDKSPGQVKGYLMDIGRVQFVHLFCARTHGVWQYSPWDNSSRAENARLYIRRCWLGAGHVSWQLWALLRADAWADIGPVMRRYRNEGGPRHDAEMLDFVTHWLKSGEDQKIADYQQLRNELGKSLPDVSMLQLEALTLKNNKIQPFERAQQLERAFWQQPGMKLFSEIYDNYLKAHAYQSAKRFYDQVEPIITERVGFSNSLGPRRYTLALLENDEPAMRAALRASATYSASDLVLEIVDRVVREDWPAVEKLIAAIEERYESYKQPGSMTQQLKAFLPLIPALKDPKHPDHDKALDYFARSNSWPTLQWMFITKYKLSTDTAVRFLGTLETDPERRLMVHYLLKDKAGFEATYNEFTKARGRWSNMAFVLVHYLRNKLLDVPVPAQQPDLKPAKTLAIVEAVTAELAKVTPVEPAEDLSKFTSADALWAHIEQIKKGPQRRPRTAAEMRSFYTNYLKSMQTAAEEFIKRYPSDPRHWDAKLLHVQTSAAGAIQNKAVDLAALEATAKEVAAARDASPTAKADADYLLVSLHSRSFQETPQPQALAALDAEIVAYEKNHPDDRRNGLLQLARIKLCDKANPSKMPALLQELSKSRYPEVAREAQHQMELREMLKKPLELKFTAVDGAAVDVAALRGKVVLVDFWATWCAPCMLEAPNDVALYKKLHEKGFEIIGISLDENKEQMLSATKQHGMVWPHFFDSKGLQNEFAVKFGIHSLPVKWLVDKKGIVRSTDAREGLQQQVEKLLAE